MSEDEETEIKGQLAVEPMSTGIAQMHREWKASLPIHVVRLAGMSDDEYNEIVRRVSESEETPPS